MFVRSQKEVRLSRIRLLTMLMGWSLTEESGLLTFNIYGKPVNREGILGDSYPLNLYHAYGIRNSFGFTFDPLTGKIWDTENGPDYGDEINLVDPGFNSGWPTVMGIERLANNMFYDDVDLPNEFFDFNGKGNYSSPEFIWQKPVAPTAVSFLGSEKFGEYENDLLVADWVGNIYHFRLNENRTALILEGALADGVADTAGEADQAIFGQGFGMITDMQIGPDGNLYIVSNTDKKILRVIPNL